MDEEERKIRWWTVALAMFWLVSLTGMVHVTRSFDLLLAEMGTEKLPLPLLTRLVVGIPAFLWILLGLLGAAGIVLKSKLVSPKRAGLIDRVALWSLGALIAAIVFALFMPITGVLMEHIQPWPPLLLTSPLTWRALSR